MPKIVTTEQMRAIEKAANAKKQTYAKMMEMAGRAVAERVKRLLIGVPEPRIAILVGPSNNGGDGLVAGRILAQELENATVGAFLLKLREDTDEVFSAARDAGIFIADAENDKAQGYRVLQNLIANADVVIDALFGTGVHLPLEGDAVKVLQATNKALILRKAERPNPAYNTPTDPVDPDRAGPIIVAVDCPSGLNCDTGELDKHAIPAHETITFGAAKSGLFRFPGADAVGRLHIGDIGLPERLAEVDEVKTILVDAAEVGSRLPHRSINSHKGTYGKTMIVAGSLNYIGAAYLAASAAYRVGTGLVTIGAPQIIVPILAGMIPEATWILLPHTMGVLNEAAVKVLREELEGYSAILVGPGLGHEDTTGEFVRDLLQPKEESRAERIIGFIFPGESKTDGDSEDKPQFPLPPLVIDADGLNLLADVDEWWKLLPADTIITPHPGEFARLAKLDTEAVQANRIELAQQKAIEWNCVVVLKGAYTVIAAPDGRTAILPFATAALASAGTGDVLAGAIAGMRAQGLEPYDAAITGGWIHAMAGARAETMMNTSASVMAGDILEWLPDAYALAEAAR